MDLALPEVAEQAAAAAERAIGTAGGIELARRAEADPKVRTEEVTAIFEGLGLLDLDPRADLESATMAAEVVRVSGRYAVPYPVVAVALARPEDGLPMALAPAPPWRVDHGDLFERWLLYDFAGHATPATPHSAPLSTRLAPFVCDLSPGVDDVEEVVPGGPLEVALLCTLWASYLLGISEAALELAVAHVKGRVQFGRPLSELQSVRFSVADATVAVDGLRELIRFTLWRVANDPAASRSDALAARLSAQEVAAPTLRLAQQLHGASGLCDEYDISVLVRHVQPALRLPVDTDAMSDILFEAISTDGFSTLFPLRAADDGGEPW
jgi:hypothetical protein